MFGINTKQRRAAAAVAAVLALGAACANPTAGPTPTVSSSDGDRIVAVASATANEFRPSFTPTAWHELNTAAQSRNVSNGSTGKSSVAVINTADGKSQFTVSLTPRRADGRVEHGHQRTKLIDENLRRLAERLSTTAANRPGLDLLDGIDNAIRGNHPGLLLVISSGLSTNGGFDLRKVGWDADPATVAQQLAGAGLLPDLRGWRVLFTGIGSTAGDQPALPLPLRTKLVDYWMAICTAAGALPCAIDDTRVPPVPSLATVETPIVPVKGVSSVEGPNNTVTAVLSNSMLGFDGDSAELSPIAVDLLRQLAERINVKTAGAETAVVTVNGYAADPPNSTPEGRRQLAQDRADATARELAANGVTARIDPHGVGTPPGATAIRGGVFDETLAEGMRRVEITY
ncbi:OmpA family protein [Actinokineospora sp.]|uniref:OmpA family protein n=1 Tax=Actinokineospora sp. TaxID=1872133 RepID=UPI0040376351